MIAGVNTWGRFAAVGGSAPTTTPLLFRIGTLAEKMSCLLLFRSLRNSPMALQRGPASAGRKKLELGATVETLRAMLLLHSQKRGTQGFSLFAHGHNLLHEILCSCPSLFAARVYRQSGAILSCRIVRQSLFFLSDLGRAPGRVLSHKEGAAVRHWSVVTPRRAGPGRPRPPCGR